MRFLSTATFVLFLSTSAMSAVHQLAEGEYQRDVLKEIEVLQLQGEAAQVYLRNNPPQRDELSLRLEVKSNLLKLISNIDTPYNYKNVIESIPLTKQTCGRLASYSSMPTPVHYHGSVTKNCLKSISDDSIIYESSSALTLFRFNMKNDGKVWSKWITNEVEVVTNPGSLVKISRSKDCTSSIDNICWVRAYKMM